MALQVVISISHDKTIRRWDLKSMTPMGMIDNAHDHGLTCIDYCSETNHIATTGGEPVAKIWDADQLTLVAVLDGHKHEVTQVRESRTSCAFVPQLRPFMPPWVLIEWSAHGRLVKTAKCQT